MRAVLEPRQPALAAHHPRHPLDPARPQGSYDSGCIYAMAGPPIQQGNDMLLFYGGDHIPHLGWKRSCLPCLARLALDHFAGFEQTDKSQPATLFSGQFEVTDEPLRITADAQGGQLSIAALDELGVTLDDTFDIKNNVIDQVVDWRHEGIAKRKGLRLHLQFRAHRRCQTVRLQRPQDGQHRPPRAPQSPALPPPPAGPHHPPNHQLRQRHQGWKGGGKTEHHNEEGAKGGYLTVNRSAQSPVKSPLAGNWPQVFGGQGARLGCHVRAPKAGGKVRLEPLRRRHRPVVPRMRHPFTPQWTESTAEIRYGWTDAEATAAGWTRSPPPSRGTTPSPMWAGS